MLHIGLKKVNRRNDGFCSPKFCMCMAFFRGYVFFSMEMVQSDGV